MSSEFAPVLNYLKAAGEVTRLRILSLLREGDLSVGELVQILDQSQPRLSHHLKTLTQAGLVERMPEGSFVFYRAASKDPAYTFLNNIFTQISPDADAFAADRARLETVTKARQEQAEQFFSQIADDWDRLRSLHYPDAEIEQALKVACGEEEGRRLVDFGTGTGRILVALAPQFAELEGIDFSHHMLTVARSNIEKAGLGKVKVRQGDVTGVPFDDGYADVVTIHQVLHYMDRPDLAISEAARVLAPGGQLIVVDFAQHELEFLRTEHGHHRLGIATERLEEWADTSGLERLSVQVFHPPYDAENGLTVNIWQAFKPDLPKEARA